jgi:hypothetical protein
LGQFAVFREVWRRFAVVTNARRLDDDDDIYDPRFPGKKVVRDGKGIRVPIQLTDGQPPEWMRTQRRPVFDARNHQPHFAAVDSAELRDARLAAHDARQAYIGTLNDACARLAAGPVASR